MFYDIKYRERSAAEVEATRKGNVYSIKLVLMEEGADR